MSILWRASAVVGFISGVLVACSGGSGDGGGSGTVADAQSFINEYCLMYGSCCGKVGKPADGEACKTVYGALMNNGTQKYDPNRGTACLAVMRSRANLPDFCTNPNEGDDGACGDTFYKGARNKAPGETCEDDGECALVDNAKVDCTYRYVAGEAGSGGTTTRTCQARISGKVGDGPCHGTRDGNSTSTVSTPSDGGSTAPPATVTYCDVSQGAYCDSTTRTCTKIEGVGGPCASSNLYSCTKDAYCDYATKKCIPRIAIDGDCSKAPGYCVANAYCDAATKKCAALRPAGADCTGSNQCENSQCENGSCKTSTSAGMIFCGGD